MFFPRITECPSSRPLNALGSFQRVLCVIVATTVLTLATTSYGQGLARLRPLGVERFRETRASQWQNWGTNLNPQSQNTQTGRAPNGAVIRESVSVAETFDDSISRSKGVVQTRNADFSTSNSLERNTILKQRRDQSNANASRGESDVPQNLGIDATLEPNSEVMQSPRLDRFSVSATTQQGDVEKSDGVLAKDGERFDFIKTVKAENLNAFIQDTKGLCVVIPHSNFLVSSFQSKGNEGKAASGGRLEEDVVSNVGVTEEEAEVERTSLSTPSTLSSHDDYIVFILTNLASQEASLLKDSHDGNWDDFDLLDASLIAEGLTSLESRVHYRSRFDGLLANLLQQTDGLQDQLKKTKKVYNFLHSHALYANYNLRCSSVAASLDSGVFNCVSATILFNCFASRAGLRVAALETTGHAKSRVKFEDSFLDIETTCSSWNKLPDRMRPYPYSQAKENEALAQGDVPAIALDSLNMSNAQDSDVSLNYVALKTSSEASSEKVAAAGSTTFAIDDGTPLGYSFTRSRRPMREITEVELVATIYYNVGVDYSQFGDYERSIASYIKAVQLAPNNKTILGNLKATLNNWAIELAMKDKDYETAILLTDLGRRIDPDFREFNMNLPIFFHDWIERLVKEEKWDEVNRVQNEYKQRFHE